MLNKNKVNEIVADMQEEERKEKLRQENIVNKFLENRLEYYVAMALEDKLYKSYDRLKSIVESDIQPMLSNEDEISDFLIKKIVMRRILACLLEYDIYVISRSAGLHRYLLLENNEDKYEYLSTYLYEDSDIQKFIERKNWYYTKEELSTSNNGISKFIIGFLLVSLILAIIIIFKLCTH